MRWDDPDLGVAWPVTSPLLAPKDGAAPRLGAIPADRLPRYEPDASETTGAGARGDDGGACSDGFLRDHGPGNRSSRG